MTTHSESSNAHDNFGIRTAHHDEWRDEDEDVKRLMYSADRLGAMAEKDLVVVSARETLAYKTGFYLVRRLAEIGVQVNTEDSILRTEVSSFDRDHPLRSIASHAKETGLWTPTEQQIVVVGSSPLFGLYCSGVADRDDHNYIDGQTDMSRYEHAQGIDGKWYLGEYAIPKGGGIVLEHDAYDLLGFEDGMPAVQSLPELPSMSRVDIPDSQTASRKSNKFRRIIDLLR